MTNVEAAAAVLLDEDTWTSGTPPERALVALFATMAPPALDRLLRDMTVRVLERLEPRAEDRERLRAIAAGQPMAVVDAAWDFPGGEHLSDAVDAFDASARLWRVPLKSLALAIAGTGDLLSAFERRDTRPSRPADTEDDRRLAWRLLLSDLPGSPPH